MLGGVWPALTGVQEDLTKRLSAETSGASRLHARSMRDGYSVLHVAADDHDSSPGNECGGKDHEGASFDALERPVAVGWLVADPFVKPVSGKA
jgi:hypothetical protein